MHVSDTACKLVSSPCMNNEFNFGMQQTFIVADPGSLIGSGCDLSRIIQADSRRSIIARQKVKFRREMLHSEAFLVLTG